MELRTFLVLFSACSLTSHAPSGVPVGSDGRLRWSLTPGRYPAPLPGVKGSRASQAKQPPVVLYSFSSQMKPNSSKIPSYPGETIW